MLKKLGVGLTIRLVGMAFTFISSVFIARVIGANAFGEYSVVISLVAILSIPSQSGYGNLIVKEISSNIAKLRYKEAEVIKVWAIKNSFIISITIVLFSVCYVTFFSNLDHELSVYLLGFLSLVIVGQNVISYSYLKAVESFNFAQIAEALLYPLVHFILCGFVWLTYGLTIELVMIARFLSLMVVLVFCRMAISKYENNGISIVQHNMTGSNSQLNKLLLPFMFSDGLRVVQAHMFILIIGWFLLSSDAAQFKVVQSLMLFVMLPATVIITMLSPLVSKLYATNKKSITHCIVRYNRIYVLVTFFALISVYLLAEPLITFAFGMEYRQAAELLVITTAFTFLSSFFGFYDVVLNMIGKGKVVLKVSVICLVLVIMLSVIAIHFYGLIGATYAFGVSILIQRIVFYMAAKKVCDFEITLFQFLTKKESDLLNY